MLRALRIDFNAPFSLWFGAICLLAYLGSVMSSGWVLSEIFSVSSADSFFAWTTYFRLILHIFGHLSLEHLLSNMVILLLVGPMLEKLYGASLLLLMSLITAIVTGLIMMLFFEGSLAGASGVVFALIILASFANARSGTVPLTFIVVSLLFMGSEILDALNREDAVARFAHLAGGLIGAIVGFAQANPGKGTGK